MRRTERLSWIVPFAVAAVGLAVMAIAPAGILPEWLDGPRAAAPGLAGTGLVFGLAGLELRRQRIRREREAGASDAPDGEDASNDD